MILDSLFQIVTLLSRDTILIGGGGGGAVCSENLVFDQDIILYQIFFILVTCLLILSRSDCTEKFNADHF